MFARILKSVIRRGSLCLIDSAGHKHWIGDGSPSALTIRLQSRSAEYRIAWNPALSLGEAYMDDQLHIVEGSLYDFLELLARNLEVARSHFLPRLIEHLGTRAARRNSFKQARRNVARHYDLSDQLYGFFLDPDRQYSCAYFERAPETLEQGQENKKRHIARKLLLDRPRLHVLDIGCGWGGLAIYLARLSDAIVTGITLSPEQYKVCRERANAPELNDRVRFHLLDYRELRGSFDRIVSVGMFEHVGKRNYEDFFTKLYELLSDHGIAVLHTIGYADTPGPINPFISKYIFPGADLPSLSEMFCAIERSGLLVTDVEVLRLHYAETLRHWRERFVERKGDVVSLYDDRFYRMWEFYLTFCEIGFRMRTNVVFQIQLAKRLDSVPLTRGYMYNVSAAAN
jgi:cyclopropane-fatty-acyl-phospholipid synthase